MKIRYATDSDSGTMTADSVQAAYQALRATITEEMIADGATLWVESDWLDGEHGGDRITLGENGK